MYNSYEKDLQYSLRLYALVYEQIKICAKIPPVQNLLTITFVSLCEST